MRLFHFSDDPAISVFQPRPVRVSAARPPGLDWLNGSLVWAIEEAWQWMYLFPRDCPRILLTRKSDTSAEDLDRWWGDRDARVIAHIEWAWLERLRTTTLYRYEFAADGFEDLSDAGMWVSRRAVAPLQVEPLPDLLAALRDEGVELRIMPRLTPLRGVWDTTLHASGIRLRNAVGWSGE